MRLHRLAVAGRTALDGEGARLYGGRWNSPGRPMVYASEHASLALLEVLVHLDLPPGVLPDYRLLTIEAPDDAPVALASAPPEDGDAYTAQGDAFLAREEHLLLRAPSVILPTEANVLINPRHPRAADVRLVAERPFAIDARLLRLST